MGFHNTHMSVFIPPAQMQKSAGTWTPTLAGDLVSEVRSAAAAAFNLFIPISLPANSEFRQGAYLKSVDVYWKNATADLSSVTTVAIKKKSLAANGSAVTGSDVAVSIDASNDTSAKRITQASHCLTVSLTSPAWVDDNDAYEVYITFDCAATSALQVFGARANYDLRIG